MKMNVQAFGYINQVKVGCLETRNNGIKLMKSSPRIGKNSGLSTTWTSDFFKKYLGMPYLGIFQVHYYTHLVLSGVPGL